MRKIVLFVFLVVTSLHLLAGRLNCPSRVLDDEGLIGLDKRHGYDQILKEVYFNTGIIINLVVVTDIPRNDLEVAAQDLYTYWGVQSKDSAILILLSKEAEWGAVSIGKSLEDDFSQHTFNQLFAGDIQYYFSNDLVEEGLDLFFNHISYRCFDAKKSHELEQQRAEEKREREGKAAYVAVIIIGVLFLPLFRFVNSQKVRVVLALGYGVLVLVLTLNIGLWLLCSGLASLILLSKNNAGINYRGTGGGMSGGRGFYGGGFGGGGFSGGGGGFGGGGASGGW